MPSLLVGTNQGGIMAYTIDIPSAKQRESKSPIVMPIGELHLVNFIHQNKYIVIVMVVITLELNAHNLEIAVLLVNCWSQLYTL